jgi:hypothetical protein
MFSYISLEERVPAAHPLRKLRGVVDAQLATMCISSETFGILPRPERKKPASAGFFAGSNPLPLICPPARPHFRKSENPSKRPLSDKCPAWPTKDRLTDGW